MPDPELLALAKSGRLGDAGVIADQVRRMLKDPRSQELVANFAVPWLGLDAVLTQPVDEKAYPQLTMRLRQALADEALMFVSTVLREDRSMLDLVECDYVFVNQLLAEHYRLPPVSGSNLRQVPVADRSRGGVLTLGAVLLATSLPNRTSPVKRGKWVLERLLGLPPPPPPMNVDALDTRIAASGPPLSLRQKTERHRSDPACSSCHQAMDPIGFGLEGYDLLGRLRDRDDDGAAIDAAGELPGSVRFRGAAELKHAIAGHDAAFTRNIAGRLLAYALGRPLAAGSYDEQVLDQIVAATIAGGYRFSSLALAIATSLPFRMTRVP